MGRSSKLPRFGRWPPAGPEIDPSLRGYAAGAVAWVEAKIRGWDWAGKVGLVGGLRLRSESLLFDSGKTSSP